MPLSIDYPGGAADPVDVGSLATLRVADPAVSDVERWFGDLPATGRRLAAWDAGMIPDAKYTWEQEGVPNRAKSHFQGIQRLPGSRVMVISAGDSVDRVSQLFFLELASRPALGPWRSNLKSGKPLKRDRLIGMLAVERAEYWHAGGITLLGEVLALPLEARDPDRSRVVFLSLADPFDPRRFGPAIERPGALAGAVALTRLPSGRFLCAVWSDADAGGPRLDLYLSTTAVFDGRFERGDGVVPPVSWPLGELRAKAGLESFAYARYQAIRFVTGADGRLWLMGTGNTHPVEPVAAMGRNYAHLLGVELPAGLLAAAPRLEAPPAVTQAAVRDLDCSGDYGGFGAAGGAYLDPASGALALYSAYHYRVDRRIRCLEFWP